MIYKNREISDIPTLELIQIINYHNNIEQEREKAASNPKFTQDRNVNGKMLKKIDFPPLSASYLEIKKALTDELAKREN